MNSDQIKAILSVLAPTAIAWMMAKGVDSTTAGLVITAVGAVGAAAFSFAQNTLTKKATAVANQNGVQVVVSKTAPVVLQALADVHPSVVAGVVSKS